MASGPRGRLSQKHVFFQREVQMAWERTYTCIDLKSFYASVERADRGLDPFATDLVVTDPERAPTRSAWRSRRR